MLDLPRSKLNLHLLHCEVKFFTTEPGNLGVEVLIKTQLEINTVRTIRVRNQLPSFGLSLHGYRESESPWFSGIVDQHSGTEVKLADLCLTLLPSAEACNFLCLVVLQEIVWQMSLYRHAHTK